MTQTIALHGSTPEINPLYIKLRRRFAYQGDRTIGEVKAQQAIRDGYQPYASPVRRTGGGLQGTAELHATRANSLPRARADKRGATRTSSISGGAVTVIILCAFLLMFLLFSGIRISELNNELDAFKNSSGALQIEERELVLAPESTQDYYAAGEEEAEGDPLSNLLRAFSEE